MFELVNEVMKTDRIKVEWLHQPMALHHTVQDEINMEIVNINLADQQLLDVALVQEYDVEIVVVCLLMLELASVLNVVLDGNQ